MILRPFRMSDMFRLAVMCHDAQTVKLVFDGRRLSVEQVTEWIRRSSRKLRETGFGARMAVLKDGGETIGHVELSRWSHQRSAELSFAIAPEYRNEGFGKEMVQGLLSALPDYPTFAWVHASNKGSRKILVECGFVILGDGLQDLRHPRMRMKRDVSLMP